MLFLKERKRFQNKQTIKQNPNCKAARLQSFASVHSFLHVFISQKHNTTANQRKRAITIPLLYQKRCPLTSRAAAVRPRLFSFPIVKSTERARADHRCCFYFFLFYTESEKRHTNFHTPAQAAMFTFTRMRTNTGGRANRRLTNLQIWKITSSTKINKKRKR